MTRKHLVALFFLLIVYMGKGQDPVPRKNYFIVLSTDRQQMQLGEYIGANYRMNVLLSTDLDSLKEEVFENCFELKADTGELLVYIHCLLGNERTFHRSTLKSLNATTAGCRQITKTLSVIWKPAMYGYTENWRLAAQSGNRLSRILQWIGKRETGTTNLFCHSMGNRVLEGMVEGFETCNKLNRPFNEVVLAAADLNADAFTQGLKSLPLLTNRIHVLTHRHDRMLLASSLMHTQKRMGRSGPDLSDSLSIHHSNIYVVDASNENLFSSLDPSNHVYFYKGTFVRKYLTKVYNHEALDRNTIQIH